MLDNPLKKIRFFDPDVGYENLWAEKNDQDFYVIKSIPYFIYDTSVDDTVRVVEDKNDSVLVFSETISHSCHTTIRIRPRDFEISDPQGKSLLDKLRHFDVIFETLPPRLIAVDIPTYDLVEPLTRFLTESSIPWEWANKAPSLVETNSQ